MRTQLCLIVGCTVGCAVPPALGEVRREVGAVPVPALAIHKRLSGRIVADSACPIATQCIVSGERSSEARSAYRIMSRCSLNRTRQPNSVRTGRYAWYWFEMRKLQNESSHEGGNKKPMSRSGTSGVTRR